MNGVILYQGKSQLNQEKIICIATGFHYSANAKTGNVIQTWIFPDNGLRPLYAAMDGQDESVCGQCPLKFYFDKNKNGMTSGGCYVNLGRAPSRVWQSYEKGNYTKFNLKEHKRLFKRKMIRLGSYGDPAAVPISVWEKVCKISKGWLGYTHQWETCDPAFSKFVMASVETLNKRKEAKSRGYRTFRIIKKGEKLSKEEIYCLADKYVKKDPLTCETCGVCCGTKENKKLSDVAITVHGEPWRVNRVMKYLDQA